MKRVVFSILVDNTSGVLSRISGLFSRRGYNIDSLTVGRTADDRYSRATVVAKGDEIILQQIENQLNKLVDVIDIKRLEPESSICRERDSMSAGTGERRVSADRVSRTFPSPWRLKRLTPSGRERAPAFSRPEAMTVRTGERVSFKSSSGPSSRIRPFPIRIIRRVSASMSCMSWVVRRMVVPRVRFKLRMNSRTANLEAASSPMVGSSRKSTFGSWRREAAISQHIRWPRES